MRPRPVALRWPNSARAAWLRDKEAQEEAREARRRLRIPRRPTRVPSESEKLLPRLEKGLAALVLQDNTEALLHILSYVESLVHPEPETP